MLRSALLKLAAATATAVALTATISAAPSSGAGAPPATASPTCLAVAKVTRGTYDSPPARFATAKVWVYGDSLTYQTYEHLLATSTRRTAINAFTGRIAIDGVRAMRSDLAETKHRPDVVVMAVGTNDLLDLTKFRATVKYARALLPKKVRLVWVNISRAGTEKDDFANYVLASTKGVKPVFWAAQVRKHPEYLTDGVHVSDAGCTARNALIRKAVG